MGHLNGENYLFFGSISKKPSGAFIQLDLARMCRAKPNWAAVYCCSEYIMVWDHMSCPNELEWISILGFWEGNRSICPSSYKWLTPSARMVSAYSFRQSCAWLIRAERAIFCLHGFSLQISENWYSVQFSDRQSTVTHLPKQLSAKVICHVGCILSTKAIMQLRMGT